MAKAIKTVSNPRTPCCSQLSGSTARKKKTAAAASRKSSRRALVKMFSPAPISCQRPDALIAHSSALHGGCCSRVLIGSSPSSQGCQNPQPQWNWARSPSLSSPRPALRLQPVRGAEQTATDGRPVAREALRKYQGAAEERDQTD